jgi:hypothetical protein
VTTERISAPRSEGVGLKLPQRDLRHEHPEWYQRDLDEPESDDPVGEDPLPTERHRTVPS